MKNIRSIIALAIFLIAISAYSSEESAMPSWILDIVSKYPIVGYVLMGLGSLAILAQVIVAITPTKKDDEFINKTVIRKILDVLTLFAPIKKK